MKPPLMLNMIVRNESARIERCLRSVLPYVKVAAINDTGSTDDTKEIIKRVCAEYDVLALIRDGDFTDFSQARNDAFNWAKLVSLEDPAMRRYCQFAILMDADMELVVDDPKVFFDLDARAQSYDMVQTGGAVSYGNRRLANLDARPDPYVGVTHEYLDLPTAGLIIGARFVDHADGFNRKDKYTRDAALLNKALETEPDNGRYLYYLGNTYRDGNQPLLAIDAYERRIKLGGWDEETHSAMMNLACCHKDAGDTAKFINGMLDAYSFRPERAEPLYDLAKYCREAGQNHAGAMFAKTGVNIKRPNDLLFVNDYVYSHGLRYEYSVTGYYVPEERARSFEVTDDLALDPTCPAGIRASAKSNLYWHTKTLKEYCPSFIGERIAFEAPEGYTAMNPSIVRHGDQLLCNIRCVNYKIDAHGRYMIGPKECGDAPIDTRNFVVQLDEYLKPSWPVEIKWQRPPPAWDMVTGLEDIRLNSVNGKLRFSATVREISENGQCQMVGGVLAYSEDPRKMDVVSWTPLSDNTSTQKNWMPFTGEKTFMYRAGIVRDYAGNMTVHPAKLYVEELCGSSQLIPFKKGWLAVIHESSNDPQGKRTYWHRFVWFDEFGALHRLSKPFVFYDRQIEFCTGLAQVGTDLFLSFGVRDEEAHIASVDHTEVSRMLSMFWI